ncbi:MAG TPA: ABC transporter substrate-binding protein [Ruminococcaceae bacterium]|nr:ABC transporter substrate-binding protein [Oscillospiraceae bacterium]
MKQRYPIALFSTIALSVAIVLTSCSGLKSSSQSQTQNGKIAVSVTFDAMAEFAKAVGGNHVSITTIIPDGTEPHDFEPKAKDMAKLTTAKVFIYNGLGMENWASKAISSANNSSLVTVDASNGTVPLKETSDEDNKGKNDPHVWLSLQGAETEVNNIGAGLEKADPAHASDYKKNVQTFTENLEQLRQEYMTKFQSAPRKDFVTGHAAFAYLCRDFSLKQNSVEDVFASGEPSASRLTDLIQYCKDNQVKTIFSEKMVSPAVSNTLAKEVGAKVKTIYTIESKEDNKSYLERIKQDLDEIDAALTESR